MGVHARAHQHLLGRGLRLPDHYGAQQHPGQAQEHWSRPVRGLARYRARFCQGYRGARFPYPAVARTLTTPRAARPGFPFPIAHALRGGRARQRKGRGCRHELASKLALGFHILPWAKVPPPAPCKIESIQQGKGFHQLGEVRNSPRFGSDDAKTGAVFCFFASGRHPERSREFLWCKREGRVSAPCA